MESIPNASSIGVAPWPSGYKGVGHLDHVWSYGVWEVVSSIPDHANIVGWVFHPTRWLVRFSHLNMPSFKMFNLFRTLSAWGISNYRPAFPLSGSQPRKKLPFRPLLPQQYSPIWCSSLTQRTTRGVAFTWKTTIVRTNQWGNDAVCCQGSWGGPQNSLHYICVCLVTPSLD